MKQQPITVYVESEEELLLLCRDAIYILKNMRHWQKEWNEHYGNHLLKARKRWEEKADQFLEKLPKQKLDHADELIIEIKNNQQ